MTKTPSAIPRMTGSDYSPKRIQQAATLSLPNSLKQPMPQICELNGRRGKKWKFYLIKTRKCEREKRTRGNKMAAPFLSTANTFLSKSSTSATQSSFELYPLKQSFRRTVTLCKAIDGAPRVTKRDLSICLVTSFVFAVGGREQPNSSAANAAILEADDDVELLEKVKEDRKRRLEKQGIINSSKKETGYLQDLVYKLSEVGQAIEKNDLSAASSVLGGSTEAEWVKKANVAFTKLSSSPEEKTEVDTFNSSLASLISSVTKNDVESSKVAFVSSASAFERWTTLTGLIDELKGL
ncbi:thylakoid lumenal 16.5 kDa protein, chloroplastic isoform X2 [Punica granatum]|nr:thylakoid lumenal 16.5 kDa protein, chloroplastic isoform X2 [Punica granatum]